MAATKLTISVPEADAELVRAYDIPLSATCQKALRAAIDTVEGKRRRIVVTTSRGREGFEGRWIIRPDDDDALTELTTYQGQGERTWPAEHYAVAVTEKGHIAIYRVESGSLDFFRTLVDAAVYLPKDVLERVAPAAEQPEEVPIIWHLEQ